jgi:hypothetical protein
MARSYSISGNATNTASATLPLLTLISSTSVQPIILAIEMGSDATAADNAVKYAMQRCTTTGTPGSSITPQALNPSSPTASTTSGLAVFSGGPTLTANAFLTQWAQNQRQAYRWQAYDLTKGLMLPATAANGVALMSLVVNGVAFNAVFCVTLEE